MTQLSRPNADHIANYPTSDAGPYSRDQWAELFYILFTGDQRATQGPFVRYLNELEVTNPAGVTIRVDTGAGMCTGTGLINSATVDFTPTTPAVSRTDKVVMCLNNTNATYNTNLEFPTVLTDYNLTASIEPYSCRLAILTGVDGGAARAPVQTASYYMVELTRYDISNAPAIANLTDYRDFCQFSSQAGPIEKHFLVPFIHGWDLSTTAPIVVTNDYMRGLPLIDSNNGRLTARWAVPDDYISSMTATPVIVDDATGVGGNVRMDFGVFYGICTQSYNTHTDQSGYILTAVAPGNVLRCLTSNTVTLTNATTDDLVTCYLDRDGGHAGDTAAMTMFGFGVLVEYTGWENK